MIKLITGDCLKILAKLPAGSVDAVVTDPPYSSGGQFRGDRTQSTETKYVQTGSIKTCRTSFTGDNRDQRAYLLWCSMWMGLAREASKPGAVILCFSDWRQLPTTADAIQCAGWIWRGMATWWKPGIRMQRGRFSHSAEYIVYGSNGPLAGGECSPQNVFSCPPVAGINKKHIAEKQLAVMEWALSLTKAGGTVLDPFMGSGTTGVACKQLGRDFIGIDLNPAYNRMARKRITAAQAQQTETV